MADVSYQPAVYRKQGGDQMVIATGGSIKFEAGGTLNYEDSTGNRPYLIKKAALGVVSGGGGILSQQLSTGTACIVHNFVVHIDTVMSGTGGTADFGVAASATATSANLIDALNLKAATGVFDSHEDGGTNGRTRQLCAAGGYVVGHLKTGVAPTGLVGNAYIHYTQV